RDGILPQWLRWLGRGAGADDSPRIGTILTLGVALLAVYLGNLNIIAPILTMFFLTTYGVVNAAAGIERLLDSPSFRPAFKVHWSLSILGAFGCLSVMFLINAIATTVAFVFVIIIFLWLQNRELQTAWGDVRKGLWMALIRAGLMRIKTDTNAKTWRPNPLVLSGAPKKRWHLIEFANAITHNRGILTIATVIPGKDIQPQRLSKLEESILDVLAKRSIQALTRVVSAENPFTGSQELVKSYGLGALVPNTIILGDSENEKIREDYCQMVSYFHELKRNVVIIRDKENDVFGRKKKIDLWWGGIKGNGGLMMILAYLLQNSRNWWDATVTVKMVVPEASAVSAAEENLQSMVQRLRMGAECEVLCADNRSFPEVLRSSSGEADLIFMGMATPDDRFVSYYENIQNVLEGLPTTILVLAGREISFGEVLMQQEAFDKE
ncbi:MAG: Na-K-Cl cotransporter, partial [Bacteroidetes bacterium]|nr:Na-K-Cl cotransporter [Bacteroidota bacterium]